MNIIKKRDRLVQHLTEAYNAEELAEMLVADYTDDEVIINTELFEED